MATDDEILARILYKLLNNKCFSKGHMLEVRVVSSVPKHERGRAKDVLKQAVKHGLVLIYGSTNQGLAYQLNIQRLNEITEFIKLHYSNPEAMKI
jgi:DNA polymerase I-like protein with 3'-5' exonuclease and polymerase domains